MPAPRAHTWLPLFNMEMTVKSLVFMLTWMLKCDIERISDVSLLFLTAQKDFLWVEMACKMNQQLKNNNITIDICATVYITHVYITKCCLFIHFGQLLCSNCIFLGYRTLNFWKALLFLLKINVFPVFLLQEDINPDPGESFKLGRQQ